MTVGGRICGSIYKFLKYKTAGDRVFNIYLLSEQWQMVTQKTQKSKWYDLLLFKFILS